jgi:hypothetical protein
MIELELIELELIELELICIVLAFYFNFFKFIMNENVMEKKFIWIDDPTSRMGLVVRGGRI